MLDHRQSARAGEALRHFLATPLDRLLDRGDRRDPAETALALFRDVAATVPAMAPSWPSRASTPAASVRPRTSPACR